MKKHKFHVFMESDFKKKLLFQNLTRSNVFDSESDELQNLEKNLIFNLFPRFSLIDHFFCQHQKQLVVQFRNWRDCLFLHLTTTCKFQDATHDKSPMNVEQVLFWWEAIFQEDSRRNHVEHK